MEMGFQPPDNNDISEYDYICELGQVMQICYCAPHVTLQACPHGMLSHASGGLKYREANLWTNEELSSWAAWQA